MSILKQLSFSAGEVTPSISSRPDLVKYSTGVKTMRNFFSEKFGGASNRPGTQFICEVSDSSKTIKFIEYIYDSDRTYVLEFGDEYMRVIKNGVLVEDSGSPYSIVTPYAEADLSELKYVQSAGTITIVHPSYAPRELTRTSDTSWSLDTITFGASIAAPASATATAPGGTLAIHAMWKITAVDGNTFEESLPVSSNYIETTVSALGYPQGILSWSAVTGAAYYNIYRRRDSGPYGFVALTEDTSIIDEGFVPDFTLTPPKERNPFSSSDLYPSTVSYFQQRRIFGGSNTYPETIYTSRSGLPKNFTVSYPSRDDDAVTFSIRGKQSNKIVHILDLNFPVILTTSGEHLLQGDNSGALTPTSVNPKQSSYNGASTLIPLSINNSAIYLQARGNIIRDLFYDYQSEGYRGNDLSLFSSHLFENKTIVSWAYQQVPSSIVWAVRSDGILLGMTYLKEHDLIAWHRHDTDGIVENVTVVPEGNEDRVYICVKRTINGTTKRYIERLYSRQFESIEDAVFMDSALSYDGRNTTSSHTMTLSGGTNWTYDETLTITSSSSFFVSGDVGNEIHITGGDGTLIRFSVKTYTSGTVVTGKPHKTVPSSMRSTAISSWSKAVDQVSGLDHLEGKNVSVQADGFVVSNPYNSSYEDITVVDGSITLDRCYSVVHVGLPYICDIETLEIDSPQQTMIDMKKCIGRVYAQVKDSRGFWAGSSLPTGNDFENMYELKIRNNENYDNPVALTTGTVEVNILSEFNSSGRVAIRHSDPLPLTILSLAPSGYV